ncbi:Xaa-Pro peptidase family protein [Pontiella agarivorans]|uniref:Xaa-Pro peptidase family protein n=1 Tax=Pontiella agarivorans TaxID=3038953 RepID=A0ABU5MWR0_9BACT|nr:Xaa-Pro peptidase family protein [Pontiella agarivorans]MDZ8118573.1 Xaa-Pro peptidase family protein [Pontiella agarivorans]
MNKLTGLILCSGSSPSTTNIHYLSGFTAPDAFLFLKTASGGLLCVSPMEKGRACSQSTPGTQVYTPQDLGLSGKNAWDFSEQIPALMKKAGVRQLKVPADFPTGLFQDLEKKGISVSVEKNPVCPERNVKTAAEISKLRKSQRAAVAAMKAGIELIGSSRIAKNGFLYKGKEKLTSETVRQRIHKTLIDYDCAGVETIVAGGDQGTDPHERGHGPLSAGQSIIIDIFPRSEKTGYWGDITRTVCRGPANPELKKLYNAVKAAQLSALKMVKPGICGDEIHRNCCDIFEQRGFQTLEKEGRHVGFIHGTGHGVGLDIHERPRIGKSGEILEAGHVITIEPGLYYPGLGGVRIEDTVVVTEDGFRFLAACPKKFELL